MKIINLMLVSAIAVSLAACSSSGGSGGSNWSTGGSGSVTEQTKAAKQYKVSDNAYVFDGQSYAGGDKVDLTAYPDGFRAVNATVDGVAGQVKIYQQPYSVVIGHDFATFEIKDYVGLNTAVAAIPATGTATYTGQAFSQNDTGTLAYTVDFDARTGNGHITGMVATTGTITLDSGTISGNGINSTAASTLAGSGTYELKFFGPQAEEIAGKVQGPGVGDVGFGGKR